MTDFLSGPTTAALVALATLLPFLAFLLIVVLTRSRPKLSARLSMGAITVSLLCALTLFAAHWRIEQPLEFTVRWVVASGITIPYGFLIDPLSLLMLLIVATISFLVQWYSLGYMAGDPGFSRYYAFMSLFAWAMLSLTVSPTLFQLYVFWELVGLASYLLIGFWYEKFSATQAGKKAFVMTRTGDVALFLGVLLTLGSLGNVSILAMNGPAAAALSPTLLTAASLLIFGGIVGKSAQFPLLTWLPDAMEGPTPVSALLHSATMVAAGVYLFARLFPFFSLSPFAMEVFLAIGTISMVLASTMAMVSRDIKKVWAYSTISQLGFMVMALGAGGYFAGIFHLTTHAGFKALLFLCSGVLIHTYGTNDMFELASANCGRLKIPTVTIVIAAAALSGVPPLSGYFSKEAIMAALASTANPVWLIAGLLGVFLTAYYSFRLIFILFTKRTRAEAPPQDLTEHVPGHEEHGGGYWAMAWPLVVLAAVTLGLGFAEAPLRGFLERLMAFGGEAHGGPLWVSTTALVLAFGGLALAWVEFGRRGAKQVGFVERIPALYALFADRWYIDRFYRWLVSRVVDRGISEACYLNDNKVIDGSIDGLSRGTVESGRVMAFLNAGMVQVRLLMSFAVMVLLALYFFF